VKAIKMFGLAALTALLAMAFVGASSAMAEDTHLCSNDVGTDYFSEHACTAVTHVHETSSVSGKEAKAVLLTSIGNTECNVLYLGDVSSTGAPLIIKGGFTYTNCVLGSSSCTATEENGPSKLKVLKTGEETAEVTYEYLIHLVCSGFLDCSYTATSLKSTAKGPLLSAQANGEVTLSEQSLTKEAGGFLCPKIARLDITTTPLSKTYVAGGLHYCVEYQHNTNGLYKDSKCTEKVEAGPYDLVVGPAGGVVGQEVCVFTGAGLWKERTGVPGVCKTDAPTLTEGSYEKGIIRTVQ
jgi:hypothetical protein